VLTISCALLRALKAFTLDYKCFDTEWHVKIKQGHPGVLQKMHCGSGLFKKERKTMGQRICLPELVLRVGGWDFASQAAYGAPTDKKDRMWLVLLRIRIRIFIFPQPLHDKTLHV
jgi:hypothetical protein